MPPDVLEALAGEVALLIKAALGPVLERLAVAEGRLETLGDVRDRVLVVETKAAAPVPVSLAHPVVDLTPVVERLAAIDVQLARLPAHEQSLGDLRDRVISVETKAVAPAPVVDLTPVLERLAAVDARLETLGDLRDRVVTLETKRAGPVSPDPALGHLVDQLTLVETRMNAAIGAVRSELEQLDGDAKRLEGYTSFLQRDAAALSERVAVVETRAPVEGPAGTNGHDGTPGKDGADGLGFDDLAVEFDGDRTLAFRFARGAVTKVFPVSLPFLRYEGVYQQGKSYHLGDTVTWGGALWHCQEATIAKPGESGAWKLCVARGRDGKAGKDGGVEAPGGLPVVSVGRQP